MTADPLVVAPETTIKELAELLDERKISGVPVVDGAEVVGIVSETDVVRKEQESTGNHRHGLFHRIRPAAFRPGRTVGQVMSAPPVTVEAWMSAAGAAWLMIEHDVGRLAVLEQGRLVGIVTRSDLVRAFARSDAEVRREIVEETLPSLGVSVSDLDVEVKNGTVRLRGTVEDDLDARCLPHAVRAVVGVVDVETAIVARHPHRIAPADAVAAEPMQELPRSV